MRPPHARPHALLAASVAAAVVFGAPCARAQSPACNEAGVRAAVERLGPAGLASLLRGRRSPGRSTADNSISGGVVTGAVVYGPLVRADCTAVAVAYDWIVTQTDLRGYDIHYPPSVSHGRAVLELRGRRLAIVARSEDPASTFDPDSARTLEVRDVDGDGRSELIESRSGGGLRASAVTFTVRGPRLVARSPPISRLWRQLSPNLGASPRGGSIREFPGESTSCLPPNWGKAVAEGD